MRLDEGIISIVCFPCHSLVITQRLIKAITQSKVLVSLNNHQLLRSPTELGTWERQTMRQIYIFDKMPIFFNQFYEFTQSEMHLTILTGGQTVSSRDLTAVDTTTVGF